MNSTSRFRSISLGALLLAGCAESAGTSTQNLNATTGFEVVLTSSTYTFTVRTPNNSSLNTLTIQPDGLSVTNRIETVEIDGLATAAMLGDLDSNGFPEVYVFVNSAGSGSYGSLVAWAVNNGKSISPIYLPDLPQGPSGDHGYSVGYMGHDLFSLTDMHLVRSFPLYRAGDVNAQPTGGTRTIRYRLTPGEAGWLLQVVDWQDDQPSTPAATPAPTP